MEGGRKVISEEFIPFKTLDNDGVIEIRANSIIAVEVRHCGVGGSILHLTTGKQIEVAVSQKEVMEMLDSDRKPKPTSTQEALGYKG